MFRQICEQLGVRPGYRDEVWVACPFCGKDKDSRKPSHFSFSPRGYKCFVCNAKGPLSALPLAGINVERVTARVEKPSRPAYWQKDPGAWVAHFTVALDRVSEWQKYRPFTLDSIGRWRLGVGVLPNCSCWHRRLVYPIFDDGKIVALRGRRIACECRAKWIQSAGSKSALFNADRLCRGALVVVSESPIDAMFLMQEIPDVVAIASSNGASTWRDEWTAAIVVSQPESVTVWYDNDLAGTPADLDGMARAWREEHPQAQSVPEPNGPKVANKLLQAGLPAKLWRWPIGTPTKADLGWMLMYHA